MGAKRSHEEFDGDGVSQGRSLIHDSDDNGLSSKKLKQMGKKHKAKEGSIEYAKKRARTIERLFKRDNDLPMDVRENLERELVSHRATVAEKSFQKKRSAMISKYHMVRFFGV